MSDLSESRVLFAYSLFATSEDSVYNLDIPRRHTRSYNGGRSNVTIYG